MRVLQAVLRDLDAEGEKALLPLAGIAPHLVLAFGAPRFFEGAGLAEPLARAFPSARRVGCSTAGEISAEGVSGGSLVVTAVSFDRPSFVAASTVFHGQDDSSGAGARLAGALLGARGQDASRLTAVFVLGQGVDINGSALIAGMTGRLGPGVALSGGLAGDEGAFRRTWVLHDGAVSDRALVAVGFDGDAFDVARGSFGGWRSFGPARRATRVSGNVLHELDGQPALGLYKRYLGEYARDLPASGLLFPFALLNEDRSDAGLIRTPLAVDEESGSITLAGDVPPDAWLRLMHASTDALVDGAETAALAARAAWAGEPDDRESLALLVSCVGRKLVMGDAVEEEVEAVSSVLGPACVLAGFYSNGEIGPYGEAGDCRLHNQTMTVTRIRET